MRSLVQPSLSFQFLASVSFIDFETGGIRMLKIVGRVLTVSALIAGASAVAWAQHGGKAEPLRIEFKPGTKTTTITEKISGSVEAEYVLMARKGQRLIIHLTSVPRRSSVFDLKAPEDADLGLEYDANYDFNGVLPKTGDYMITVVRPTSSPGSSTYKMVVTVK